MKKALVLLLLMFFVSKLDIIVHSIMQQELRLTKDFLLSKSNCTYNKLSCFLNRSSLKGSLSLDIHEELVNYFSTAEVSDSVSYYMKNEALQKFYVVPDNRNFFTFNKGVKVLDIESDITQKIREVNTEKSTKKWL